MATPKRFSGGVTNVGAGEALSNLPTMSPIKVHMFFDDFNYYDDAAAGAAGGHWATTSTQNNTILEVDGDGGIIALTTSKDDDSMIRIQGVKECFAMEAGKKAWFGCRMRHTVVSTETDWIMALAITDTSPVASSPASWIGFVKNDGDDYLDIGVTSAGVGKANDTNIGGYAGIINTWYKLEWDFDGVDTFQFWVDDVLKASLTTADFPTTEMTPTMGFMTGSQAISTIQIDYIYMAKER
jgi:hypothetical protein